MLNEMSMTGNIYQMKVISAYFLLLWKKVLEHEQSRAECVICNLRGGTWLLHKGLYCISKGLNVVSGDEL